MTDNVHGTVVQYTTAGATISATFITGLSNPHGIAVVGTDLYLTNNVSGTVGWYSTSGAILDASLITGLSNPLGIAVAVIPESAAYASIVGLLALGMVGVRRWHNLCSQSR